MKKHTYGSKAHSIAVEFACANFGNQSPAANNIGCIRKGTNENEKRAKEEVFVSCRLNIYFAKESDYQTNISDDDGQPLQRLNLDFKKHSRHQQHQRGVDEQNESLDARRNILQSHKIQQAADVITQTADQGDVRPLFEGELYIFCFARGNKGGTQKERNRKNHSPRK